MSKNKDNSIEVEIIDINGENFNITASPIYPPIGLYTYIAHARKLQGVDWVSAEEFDFVNGINAKDAIQKMTDKIKGFENTNATLN